LYTSDKEGQRMRTISRYFIRGLLTLIPIAVTLYVFYLLGWAAESSLGAGLQVLLPESYYVSGMGLLVGLATVVLVGFMVSARLVRTWFGYGEHILARLPLVSIVYGSTRDLMGFFRRAREGQFDQVVMVPFGNTDMRLMGFVTRDDFSDMPAGVGDEDSVAVYLPMSYQLGGYTVILPRSLIRPVPISMREAMRFAVTAGMPASEDMNREFERGRRHESGTS
jgi:uncharacterized membrane protein